MVLENHENDFMAAYKGHMMKVKRELEFLRDKAVEAAGKLSNDDSITNLQQKIKWFQQQALVLDSILEGQKREVQKLKTNRINTISDNKFIKQQVKDAIKHNKLLEVALNKTQKQSDALRQFLKENKNLVDQTKFKQQKKIKEDNQNRLNTIKEDKQGELQDRLNI